MEGNGAMLDEGATPMRIATEANSTANHVREDFRDYRIEQAKVNRSLTELIANVDRNLSRRVSAVNNILTDFKGEAKGEAKATRRMLTIAGLIVGALAAVDPVLHLIRAAH